MQHLLPIKYVADDHVIMSVVPSPGAVVVAARSSPVPSSALATAAAAASRLNASIATHSSSSTTTLPSSLPSSLAAAAGAANDPSSEATVAAAAPQFGRIVLDISNSVMPASRLTPTPSSKDGLTKEAELQLRSLGCDLIQLAGKLLKLPQVGFDI